MEFEVLGEHSTTLSPFDALASYLRNRRRQLQDWEANPPHRWGLAVLLLASLEIVLTLRLYSGSGLTEPLVSHVTLVLSGLLLIEAALAKIAAEVGAFFNRKGKMGTAITFFNLGLLPFLFVLPLGVMGYGWPAARTFVLFAWLVMGAKVLINWRESLEISYEMNRLQSAIVLYLGSGFFLVGLLLAAYIGAATSLTKLLG